MSYIPGSPPGDQSLGALAAYVAYELRMLERALVSWTTVQYVELHVEPARPRVGMVAYADGTDWDPGSGEGLYVYKSGGWTLLA